MVAAVVKPALKNFKRRPKSFKNLTFPRFFFYRVLSVSLLVFHIGVLVYIEPFFPVVCAVLASLSIASVLESNCFCVSFLHLF